MRSPLYPDDPTRLGPYTLVSRLGEGGMGTVYLGRHADGRQVAIKVIRSEYARDDRFRRRFRSEVNRARQVPPFCTAEVLDADPDHIPPYLVVEYIDGPNLTDVVLEHGPLALANLHSVAVGIATALTAIHGAGVIHRDLKPGNVLFTLGGIKVIDFGIARALEATSHHTRTDHMVGTIAYMAPERFEPESTTRISPAADIFSWGAVVAYAATGHTPFSADSAPGTVMRILTQPPDLSGLPDSMCDLVDAALAKEPHNRPTARELLDRLLASAPSPLPVARQHEVPFLREVMRSAADHGTPATAGRSGAVGAASVSAPPSENPESVGRPIVLTPRPDSRTPTGRARSGTAQPGAGQSGTAHPGRAPRSRRALPGRVPSGFRPPLRRWLTQASVAATVLVMLLAGSLAYRALGSDGDADEPAAPNTLTAPASSAPADPGGIGAILKGQRKALLRVRDVGKDLSLTDKGAATVSGEARQRTAFVLEPIGRSYLIRTHEPVQGEQTCLGVRPASDSTEALTIGSCAETYSTRFEFVSTGETDEQGRPTYYLNNTQYGTVQWSSDQSKIIVDTTDLELVETTFVLVDQGPA